MNYQKCPHYSIMVEVLASRISLQDVGFNIEDISACTDCLNGDHKICDLWINVLIANDLSEQVGIEGAEVTIQNLDKRNEKIAFALLKSFTNNSSTDAQEEPVF